MANLFISHSWKYGDQYNRLKELLASRGYEYRDYSVPSNKPILFDTDKELENAIEQKIILSSVVIIMAGVYSTYSTWINKEIELAKKWNKPIIAVEPYASERTSPVVKNAADIICGWNTKSIVNAISELTE
ncbi:TIR domain-containing protein [Actinobacillus equuli subsp. haemolyticus]|uniref:TIR domain-containing protein n=1 Tax=Actinobacillus equuli TaxID=718 RepID=UPI00244217F2|nr:TIR domain-containing protein [Actinobacillus equuli]WGE64076.1 TIR domain-containing protein [Actinobacillus equuli subsp. haemolyticus]